MIFCVEDDISIRELVVYTLKNTGFDARGMSDADELFEALKSVTPILVLLDIMLPGKDGIEILSELKQYKPDIPVIMLTAKSTEYDKVSGLDGGADDYITKPFGMMELISRIKAVLRRTSANEAFQLTGGNIVLDVKKHSVRVDSKIVELTHKEYELLQLLLQRKGEVVKREELIRLVWGYDFEGESRTLDVHMRTLRQKLGEAGNILETVRSVGYRVGE